MTYGVSNGHVSDNVTWPQRCSEAERSAILATAWLLVVIYVCLSVGHTFRSLSAISYKCIICNTKQCQTVNVSGQEMNNWGTTSTTIHGLLQHTAESQAISTTFLKCCTTDSGCIKLLSNTVVNQTRKPSYRWQTRATRKPAEIASIRRAYNVVVDNTGLSSCV